MEPISVLDLRNLNINDNGINIIKINNGFFGKKSEKEYCYILKSRSKDEQYFCQSTKLLDLDYNIQCKLVNDQEEIMDFFHVITLKSNEIENIEAFIRISYSFSEDKKEKYGDEVLKYFSYLINLFSKVVRSDQTELQGLFGELYFIWHFYKNYQINLTTYYQSKDNMKFDFSLPNSKRIEVKTTLNSNRIHHFRHEQLISYKQDIKVVSILLRESDRGISLSNLIDLMVPEFISNSSFIQYIEKKIYRLPKNVLDKHMFDIEYLSDNLRVFDAENIPKMDSKTPNGVTKVEYDSDLSLIADVSINSFCDWIVDDK
ncbi:MAG: PD-(D/E)XK motif protein [Acholeplasmatales bacterium]|jgi:hypothetical protein|nr:PD-(D/E)XK motif protein [Acholeplasmatales bacterium]